MSETVFVTGATGLAGANVCKLLTERGDNVRALAREGAEIGPVVAMGVHVVPGDITAPTTCAERRPVVTPPSTALHCSVGPARTCPTFRP